MIVFYLNIFIRRIIIYTYILILKGVEFGQKVNISLSMNYVDNNPFKESYISEFLSKNSDSVNKYNISPESKIVEDNLLKITFSFIIKYEDETSFALSLIPNYDIVNINAKIEANYIFYNFINGIPQKITDFINHFHIFSLSIQRNANKLL